MERFELWIPGRPIPKPQKFTRKSHPQWAWRDKIGWKVKAAIGGSLRLEESVALGMQFYINRHGKRKPPDFKNLWACVEDGLTGILYEDDVYVDRVICPSGRTIIDRRSNQAQGVNLIIEFEEGLR